uniref:Distal-less homeobox 2 n=1 Tax=Crocodylus porosus TaxID=8502 RepID=A0A7M4F676_CROPO
MTGVFDSLVSDMHSSQMSSGTYHQQHQHGGLHKSQESPTLPVSTATDSSYYTNQQQHGAGGGGSPYAQMGSYQYHAPGINPVPYAAKAGYDLGYSATYGSYGPYGTRASPATESGTLSASSAAQTGGGKRPRAAGGGGGGGEPSRPPPRLLARAAGAGAGAADRSLRCSREGRLRARGQDSEREAKESAEAPDHLLQLPAGRSAAALPEDAVPGAARESGAGGLPRPHPDAGEDLVPEPPLQVQEDVEERRDPVGAAPAAQRLAALRLAARLRAGLGLRPAPAPGGRRRRQRGLQPQQRGGRRFPRELLLVPPGLQHRLPGPAARAAPAPPPPPQRRGRRRDDFLTGRRRAPSPSGLSHSHRCLGGERRGPGRGSPAPGTEPQRSPPPLLPPPVKDLVPFIFVI